MLHPCISGTRIQHFSYCVKSVNKVFCGCSVCVLSKASMLELSVLDSTIIADFVSRYSSMVSAARTADFVIGRTELPNTSINIMLVIRDQIVFFFIFPLSSTLLMCVYAILTILIKTKYPHIVKSKL